MAGEKKRTVQVEMVAKMTDPETGEVLGRDVVLVDLPTPEDMDIETEEGVLRGLGQFERAVLEGRDSLMDGLADTCFGHIEKKKPHLEPRMVEAQTLLGTVRVVVSRSFRAGLKPKETIRSVEFEEAVLEAAACVSFRKATMLVNRLLPGQRKRPLRTSTLCERVEKVGGELDRALERHADQILRKEFPEMEGAAPTLEQLEARCGGDVKDMATEAVRATEAWLSRAAARFNEGREPPCQILPQHVEELARENPLRHVYISADEVGVTRQKEERGSGKTRATKRVEHSVIMVECAEGRHVIEASDMDEAHRRLLALLVENGLLDGRKLVFFSDGAQNIRTRIESVFGFRPTTHFLDWHHLEKRVGELLSMAHAGTREEKRRFRSEVARLLWVGNCPAAIQTIRRLDPGAVRSRARLEELVAYLERKRPCMTCYALRRIAALRNSSNPAEKANDLVVAQRQKHKGSSWSMSGSHALAQLTAVSRNGGLRGWMERKEVSFSIANAA